MTERERDAHASADFRLLFEGAPGLYLVLLPDDGFTIVAVTDAYLQATRTQRSDLLGRGLFEVFPDTPDDVAATGTRNLRGSLEQVRKLHTADTMAVQKHDIRRPDSEGGGFVERFWSPINFPVLGPAGDLAYILHRVQDVTDLVRLEARAEQSARQALAELTVQLAARTRELEEQVREIEGFSYSVSHDLRAPLRAVDGFAKILLEEHGAALGAEGQRVARVICNSTQRMGELIDDLLAFNRAGRQPMQLGDVDMKPLADDVVRELAEPGRSIEFSVGELPAAFGDRRLLRQVWVDLLGNAVKYTRPRDTAVVEVSGAQLDREIVYTVKDNGVGFDDRFAAKLFGVFQRLHTHKEFEGTGVGLALVDRIIRRHGGWIRGESQLGVGATFTFGLPRKDG